MREIKKGDKYICKVNDYDKGYFTKGNIYEVHFVNGSNIILLTDSDFAYCLSFNTLNKDFTDLQEVQMTYDKKEIESLVKEYGIKPYILNEIETPKHYKTNSIDVIDFCKLYNLNFNLGNIVKYACRVGKKENDIEDLKKVIDYAQREIKFLENN